MRNYYPSASFLGTSPINMGGKLSLQLFIPPMLAGEVAERSEVGGVKEPPKQEDIDFALFKNY